MLNIKDILNTTISGDVIDILPTLPDKCVHSIITSPPYFAVRDYKLEPTNWPEVTFSLFGFPVTIPAMTCQLGLEKTPFEFVAHIVYVFRLAHRVLRDDGTMFINMGDCYSSGAGHALLNDTSYKEFQDYQRNGYFSENLYDEHKDFALKSNQRTEIDREIKQFHELLIQSRANMESQIDHFPNVDLMNRKLIEQFLSAIHDLSQNLILGCERLLSVRQSTSSEFLKQSQAFQKPGDLISLFQSSLRTLISCVLLFEYMLAESLEIPYDNQHIVLLFSELHDHIQCTYGYYSLLFSSFKDTDVKPKRTKIKSKDMIGIPWLMAFALRDDGWYLRQDIIWHKPNPMPESVNDRCTKAHEYIFLFSKSKRYYFDADSISTEIADETVKRYLRSKDNSDFPSNWGNSKNFKGQDPREKRSNIFNSDELDIKGYDHKKDKNTNIAGHSGYFNSNGELIGNGKANKKSVWTIPTKSFKEAHFATFPEDLPVDMIKAGTSKHGVCSECGGPWKMINEKYIPSCKCNAEIVPAVVMDIFSGAGTTRLISRKLERNFIGIDKNPGYNQIEETRIATVLGMFR